MEYYVRFDDRTIDGPFSVGTVRDLVQQGRLSLQAGVVEAKGQGLPALRDMVEWTSVSQLLDGVGGTIAVTPIRQTKPASPELWDFTTPHWPVGSGREMGAVLGLVGFVLLLFGALRWNSLESQFMRAAGQGDGLGISLLLGGAVALAFGGYSFFSAVNATRPESHHVVVKIDERIRQLDDLKAKGLITEAQYEQRKAEIIASI